MATMKSATNHIKTLTALAAVSVILIGSGLASAQVPEAYYRQNCMSCHTIGGGRLTGPDLKDVSDRQNRAWLVDWMLDPEGVLGSGDPYAAKLQKEARGAVMTRSPGITRELAIALLDLIDAESLLDKSTFAGVQVSDRALLPEDVAEGRALFMGSTPLKNGGPACIGCHHVNSAGSLGGGKLGLNLTRAYARLEGRKGLAAWLVAPPSLTMSPLFSDHPIDEEEILPLIAFMKQETEQDLPESSSATINFVLSGIFGAGVLLVIFDRLWGKRFKAVRRPLYDATYSKSKDEA